MNKGKREKKEERGSERSSRLLAIGSMVVLLFAIGIMFIGVTQVKAEEVEVNVTVSAPEYAAEEETFNVTIDVDHIKDFHIGQFDLLFNSTIVSVKEVTDGCIDNTEIPNMWRRMGSDTIRVISELPVSDTESGAGYLAKVKFRVKGVEGEITELNLSNGKLMRALEPRGMEEIPAEWIGGKITIGVEEEVEETPAPTPRVTPSPTPISPSFEAIFAIAVMIIVVYVLRRRK